MVLVSVWLHKPKNLASRPAQSKTLAKDGNIPGNDRCQGHISVMETDRRRNTVGRATKWIRPIHRDLANDIGRIFVAQNVHVVSLSREWKFELQLRFLDNKLRAKRRDLLLFILAEEAEGAENQYDHGAETYKHH